MCGRVRQWQWKRRRIGTWMPKNASRCFCELRHVLWCHSTTTNLTSTIVVWNLETDYQNLESKWVRCGFGPHSVHWLHCPPGDASVVVVRWAHFAAPRWPWGGLRPGRWPRGWPVRWACGARRRRGGGAGLSTRTTRGQSAAPSGDAPPCPTPRSTRPAPPELSLSPFWKKNN